MLLGAFTSFYGFPIIIGWSSGRISMWTIAMSAAMALAIAVLSCVYSLNGRSYLRRFRCALAGMPLGEKALWTVIGCIIVLLLFIASLLPIRTWDAAAYHATNPMRWAQTHRFTLDTFGAPELSAYLVEGEVFPNVKAILPFISLDLTGREAGTAAAQWPFLLLLIASLNAIFRRLHTPGWACAIGVLFCLMAPEILLQSLEAYADIVFFASQMAVVWICLATWQDGPSKSLITLGALAFASLAGSKPTGLPMGAALGAVFIIIIFARSRNDVWKIRLSRALCALALVMIVCAAIAGPWYAHGILKFHNPIYPVTVDLLGKTILPGATDSDLNTVLLRKNTGADGLRAWWNTMIEKRRAPLISSWSGGLGAHAFILGLPAALLFAVSIAWRPWRGDRLMFLATLLVMLAATTCPCVARFILFLLCFMAAAFAWVLDRSTLMPRIILMTAFLLLISYNAVRALPALLSRNNPPETTAFALLSGHTRAAQKNTFPDEFDALDYWREHVAGPGRKLAIPAELAPWMARPLAREADVVREPNCESTRSFSEWQRQLRESGATHLYLPRTSPAFDPVMLMRDRYRLIIHRVDHAAEHPWMEPSDQEAALFEILRPGSVNAGN
ncbi:MAG: hypothetical protein WCK47_05965 [bacterium]|nr:hypothetical protein [Candidatus Sumerlaeota bacterium]